MNLIKVFLAVPVLAILLIPFLKVKGKGIVLFAAIVLNAFLSGSLAVQTLAGQFLEFSFAGSLVTGPVNLRMDALSGWFILIINFVFITGSFYGLFYMNTYQKQKNNLTLHSIVFILLHTALISLCAIQNSLVFLIAWEIMALSAFFSVIFEHEKMATLSAGINYLIQSHVSIVFLMLGFIWVALKTGSYDFNSLTATQLNIPELQDWFCFSFFSLDLPSKPDLFLFILGFHTRILQLRHIFQELCQG